MTGVDRTAGARTARASVRTGGAPTTPPIVDDGRGEVLVHALGGGLGHLARACRVVRALGLEDRAVLLTASRHAGDVRATGGLPVVAVDPAAAGDPAALLDLIAARAPARIVVDAFPLGVAGELEGLCSSGVAGGPRVDHVARRLRWDVYRPRFGAGRVRFGTTLVLEPLEPAHEAFLRDHSDRMVPWSPPVERHAPRRAHPGPHWLVVHSGPDEETLELVAHAREHQAAEGTDLPIVVLSPTTPPGLPDDVLVRDELPAAPFLAAADRLVTAAGWNVLDESRPFRGRHHVVPFERALDDQPWRARHVRRELGPDLAA
ncbi:hypothetical protein [Patulibacter minatonensis]|uniref:hypothetical protein n=1 Tax=Patulibacter minatonensis TaxID=298163 RepID=UPI0012F95895|nr:hypothetical protein [Patulibacter minatonensis]